MARTTDMKETPGVWWRVIGVDGTDYGDLTTDSPLSECDADTVVPEVLSAFPALDGKGFEVSDDETAKLYILWAKDRCYEEYTFTGHTSERY